MLLPAETNDASPLPSEAEVLAKEYEEFHAVLRRSNASARIGTGGHPFGGMGSQTG